MLVVTGGAGFIGSRLVRALNDRGERDVIVVDSGAARRRADALADCRVRDYLDKTELIERLSRGALGRPRAILHQGACSDTMEADRRYVMETNLEYSRRLLEVCLAERIPLIYASSAAVYGGSTTFVEAPEHERPLNAYAESKHLFDEVVRAVWRDRGAAATSQIVGLRYFNVYGPHEAHKGRMASMAFHHVQQFRAEGKVRLFGAYGGYGAGEQRRDFVAVEDVVNVNLYFLDRPERSGIFNVGTGRAQPFNLVASTVVNSLRGAEGLPPLPLASLVGEGLIEYVPFPDDLCGRYQCWTEADLGRLRGAGYARPFRGVAEGVSRYCGWLLGREARSTDR